MKKYFVLIMVFVLAFANPIKISASSTSLESIPSYNSYIKGKDYVLVKNYYTNREITRYYLITGMNKATIEKNGSQTTYRFLYDSKSEMNVYALLYKETKWELTDINSNYILSSNALDNEYLEIVNTTIPIYNIDETIYKEPTGDKLDSIDIGYTNYNDTVTSSNSVYDTNIPYIKNFKVVKTKGPGALAQHNLTWLSSEDLKQMRVEVALAYKVEASDSWFLNKKYNEGFAYYRTYADGLMSAREILNVPLSTSSPDGSFKDSVTTCIVGDLKSKFGDKEAMAIINATESNLKAYYIRNVVFKDGKYHYSQWVRCKVGSSYSVGHGGVVDENGMKYEDKEDYPVDPNGNPEYDADGGRGESGFAILDFLYGVFDSITGIFTAFVDGVGIVMEGVGKLPTAFGTIFGALPEPVSVVFVMGMMICVFMRFLKR